MCDEKRPELCKIPYTPMDRRQFATLIAAAATGLGSSVHAQAAVVAREVEVKTPDGTCDAALFHPGGQGQWPGVFIWPSAGGLGQQFRDMGRRLAGQGYVVLAVNPYYRVVTDGNLAKLTGEARTARLATDQGRSTQPEAVANDSKAFIAYLDALPQTSNAKVGVQGYCRGGSMAVRAAAAVPDRVGAVGSFHGGNGLVSQAPTSPHLLIPKTNARFIFATAQNDDATAPTVKDDLKAALAAANRPGVVEVYKANHGWCVPGGASYDQAEAERAWAALTAMYKLALV